MKLNNIQCLFRLIPLLLSNRAIFSKLACGCMILIFMGCAGMNAYKEGNKLLDEGRFKEGLAKLEMAIKHEPKNAEYRIMLAYRKASIINTFLEAGDIARRNAKLTEAEKVYRQVHVFDPENTTAQQALETLTRERRHREILKEAETLFTKGGQVNRKNALEKIRIILSENPRQKEARKLKARIHEIQYKERRLPNKLASAFNKPISLEFRDAPLKSVLEVVSELSGLNFFYDKDISPDLKVTIFAKDTTIEDAMRLLLLTNQMKQKILNENTILIYPNTSRKLKEYQTLMVRSFYLTNGNVNQVSNTIKTIVKSKDIVVDERLRMIIMRDTPEAIKMAERIVTLQDLSDPEVVLDVEILEVKHSKLMELGIRWPSQLILAPLRQGNELLLRQLGNLNSSNVTAAIDNMVLNLRKENQDTNILANPRIRVRDKEKAKIQIGERVPTITTSTTSTGVISESVNYVDVGLTLEVEPTIHLDGEVAINIKLEVSNLIREISSKSGTLSYQIGNRTANTVCV